MLNVHFHLAITAICVPITQCMLNTHFHLAITAKFPYLQSLEELLVLVELFLGEGRRGGGGGTLL